MSLLQRVVTLIRANLADLVRQADDPESAIKQLVLDLNNQLIQVKTRLAQSMADEYLLDKRLESARAGAAGHERRAQEAVGRGNDDAARAELSKLNSFRRTAEQAARQLEEQRRHSESLRQALGQLGQKIAEVKREGDIVLARQRRAEARETLAASGTEIDPDKLENLLDAISGYVEKAEAQADATEEVHGVSDRQKVIALEHDDAIEQQLAALKARRAGK